MKRRVLFTASTYSHIYHFHRPYLLEFRRRGWQVDVACGGAPIELPEADQVIDVPFEKSMTSPKNLAAVRLLHREIRDAGYELISCHTALAAFFTRMAVRGLSHRPIVACTAHGYLFTEQGGVHRFLLEGAEALCAPVTDLLMTMNRWDNAYATAHRLGRTIVDIPGMGPRMAAVIVAEIGDFRRFSSPDKLLAYAGLSPTTYQSGQLTSTYAKMEKRGSRYLRFALFNATKYVCVWDPTFRAYLAKKRAEGKHYNVAVSHAAKKLVRLIYHLETTGETYVSKAC